MSAWLPISTAPKEPGQEVIGACFQCGYMLRDPFLSFWSPTLGRFYLNPTHWMPLPSPPSDAKREARGERDV